MTRGNVWQGKLDMLCGVYCAAHILALPSDGDYDAIVDKHFIDLLKSAETAELLTASKIGVKGYKQNHLEAIFNGISISRTNGFRAARLSGATAKALLRNHKKKDLIRKGVFAIVEEKYDSGHWIAVIGLGLNDTYYCYDSSLEDDLTGERKSVSWKRGVLIVPEQLYGNR